jgi:hypothetical protein
MKKSGSIFIRGLYRGSDVFLVLALLAGILAFTYTLNTGVSSNWTSFVMAVSGIFVAGIGFSFFFESEVRLNFSLVLFFSYITFLAVDHFLGIKSNNSNIINAAKKAGIDFDTRSSVEVYQDFKKSDSLGYPVIFPFFVFPGNPGGLKVSPSSESSEKILPLGGISNSKSLFCNETGKYISYKSDRYGFNNDDTAYDQRIDTLLVGDSFTQGMCVPAGKDIAGSLRKMGRNAVTIAMGGNGPLLELAALKEYGPHLKPESVVWMIFEGNDYLELSVEKNNFLLMKYLQENFSQGLVEKQDVIDRVLKTYLEQVERVFSSDWESRGSFLESPFLKAKKTATLYNLRARLGITRYWFNVDHSKTGGSSSLDEENIELLKLIFKSAVEITKKWGGKLNVAYIMDYANVEKGDFSHNKKVLTIMQELGIPVIEISEVFSKAEDPLIYFHYRLPSHYTAEGYGEIAGRIDRYLTTDLSKEPVHH